MLEETTFCKDKLPKKRFLGKHLEMGGFPKNEVEKGNLPERLLRGSRPSTEPFWMRGILMAHLERGAPLEAQLEEEWLPKIGCGPPGRGLEPGRRMRAVVPSRRRSGGIWIDATPGKMTGRTTGAATTMTTTGRTHRAIPATATPGTMGCFGGASHAPAVLMRICTGGP